MRHASFLTTGEASPLAPGTVGLSPTKHPNEIRYQNGNGRGQAASVCAPRSISMSHVRIGKGRRSQC